MKMTRFWLCTVSSIYNFHVERTFVLARAGVVILSLLRCTNEFCNLFRVANRVLHYGGALLDSSSRSRVLCKTESSFQRNPPKLTSGSDVREWHSGLVGFLFVFIPHRSLKGM